MLIALELVAITCLLWTLITTVIFAPALALEPLLGVGVIAGALGVITICLCVVAWTHSKRRQIKLLEEQADLLRQLLERR